MDLGNFALNRNLAEQHCNRGELDCRWYHGNWELLKSLGMVSTCGVHARELTALVQLALDENCPAPKILISGSTDATLLQILASSCSEKGHTPDFTAVDICATPLELMRRHALESGLRFSSVRADLLEYCPGERFDLIVTHAFMGNFDAVGRARLVRKWASMLSEGGSVVTIQRVRPADSPSVVRFTVDQARRFIDGSLDAAAQASGLQPTDLPGVAAAAAAFTELFFSYAITSRADMEQLFLDAGLSFRYLEYHAQTPVNDLAGPSVPSGGEFAFIVASRESP
jgi:SAM-dependent methyltransferase